MMWLLLLLLLLLYPIPYHVVRGAIRGWREAGTRDAADLRAAHDKNRREWNDCQ